ncbi:hypothetical protein Pelo_10369 [Pelomyxa schiedti]|nr:hypothetical protein Pelo_10369 [Pelomyxa schiedti]
MESMPPGANAQYFAYATMPQPMPMTPTMHMPQPMQQTPMPYPTSGMQMPMGMGIGMGMGIMPMGAQQPMQMSPGQPQLQQQQQQQQQQAATNAAAAAAAALAAASTPAKRGRKPGAKAGRPKKSADGVKAEKEKKEKKGKKEKKEKEKEKEEEKVKKEKSGKKKKKSIADEGGDKKPKKKHGSDSEEKPHAGKKRKNSKHTKTEESSDSARPVPNPISDEVIIEQLLRDPSGAEALTLMKKKLSKDELTSMCFNKKVIAKGCKNKTHYSLKYIEHICSHSMKDSQLKEACTKAQIASGGELAVKLYDFILKHNPTRGIAEGIQSTAVNVGPPTVAPAPGAPIDSTAQVNTVGSTSTDISASPNTPVPVLQPVASSGIPDQLTSIVSNTTGSVPSVNADQISPLYQVPGKKSGSPFAVQSPSQSQSSSQSQSQSQPLPQTSSPALPVPPPTATNVPASLIPTPVNNSTDPSPTFTSTPTFPAPIPPPSTASIASSAASAFLNTSNTTSVYGNQFVGESATEPQTKRPRTTNAPTTAAPTVKSEQSNATAARKSIATLQSELDNLIKLREAAEAIAEAKQKSVEKKRKSAEEASRVVAELSQKQELKQYELDEELKAQGGDRLSS